VHNIAIKLRALRVDEHTSSAERLARRAAAELLVSQADRVECALLLQLFMVSLIAKDASLMVSFRACALNDSQCGGFTPMAQTATHCGIAVLPGDGGEQDPATAPQQGFMYTVGLIDLGLKALDKLWRKELEEDEVCATAEAVLGHAAEC
jgi:hypothetical protein